MAGARARSCARIRQSSSTRYCRNWRSTCPRRSMTRRSFSARAGGIWLEIGFGGGEHLAAEAEANPDCRASSAASFSRTASSRRWHGSTRKIPTIFAFIAAMRGDHRRACRTAPLPASICSIPILGRSGGSASGVFFPTPCSPRLAGSCAAGGAIRFATDIDDNAGWTLARILRSPDFEWRAQTAADWRVSLVGLGLNPLRGKGARGGTPARLSDLRAP